MVAELHYLWEVPRHPIPWNEGLAWGGAIGSSGLVLETLIALDMVMRTKNNAEELGTRCWQGVDALKMRPYAARVG